MNMEKKRKGNKGIFYFNYTNCCSFINEKQNEKKKTKEGEEVKVERLGLR